MSRENHLNIAHRLATLLDDRFEILGIRFGLDPLLDLIPGLGDILAVIIGFYIVYVARMFDLPESKISQMFINLALDFIIGLIPVAGNIGTIFFRSNRMNIRILDEFLAKPEGNIEEGEIVG